MIYLHLLLSTVTVQKLFAANSILDSSLLHSFPQENSSLLLPLLNLLQTTKPKSSLLSCTTKDDCPCRFWPDSCFCNHGTCGLTKYECVNSADCSSLEKCSGVNCKCSDYKCRTDCTTDADCKSSQCIWSFMGGGCKCDKGQCVDNLPQTCQNAAQCLMQGTTVIGHHCFDPPRVTGASCTSTPSTKWTFENGVCKDFEYGGCDGNENRFDSKSECENICLGTGVMKNCQDPPGSVGPCKAYVPKWTYSNGQCKEFSYGGCGGNGNRFNSKLECEEKCAVITTPGGWGHNTALFTHILESLVNSLVMTIINQRKLVERVENLEGKVSQMQVNIAALQTGNLFNHWNLLGTPQTPSATSFPSTPSSGLNNINVDNMINLIENKIKEIEGYLST